MRAFWRITISMAFLLLVAALPAVGQEPEATPPAPAAEVEAGIVEEVAAPEPAVPMPPSAEPVAPPEATSRAQSYYRSGIWVWFLNYGMALLIPAIILFTGLSVRMRKVATKIGRFWPLAAVIYLVLYVAVDFVLAFPQNYYLEQVRDPANGLAGESFGEWLVESVTSLVPAVILLSVMILLLYGFMRLSPKRWWLFIGLAIAPINIAEEAIDFKLRHPVFQEASDQALAEEARELARRVGFEEAEVYESSSSGAVAEGAVVEGFMGNVRILLGTPGEVEMSREQQLYMAARGLGYYRLHQQLKYNLVLGVLAVVAFYLMYRVAAWLVARFKHRWGFDQLNDLAAWPLYPALFNFCFLLVQPIDAGVSRYIHHEADRFGLELYQDNRACAQSFVDLADSELTNPDPGPIYSLWRSFRPSPRQRVEFCNTYRPWETGEPLHYEDLIAGERSAAVVPERGGSPSG